VKPTEILLDLNDLKLGRIVKKDFEEVVPDIYAAKMSIESPAPFKGAETLPTAPVKGFETAPKAFETRKAAESK
jgi:hypothetical protein